MKPWLALALACVALTPAVAKVGRVACNVDVDVTDTDPKGTHLRAAPGGRILKTLTASGDGWNAVHVVAQLGDWFEISQARLLDPALPSGEKLVFRGTAYLHRSVLGVSGLQNGATIYPVPDDRSRALEIAAPGDQSVDLLGCSGRFLKVHVAQGTGWTRQVCLNMLTTCS
jgi:hypothetical protein